MNVLYVCLQLLNSIQSNLLPGRNLTQEAYELKSLDRPHCRDLTLTNKIAPLVVSELINI